MTSGPLGWSKGESDQLLEQASVLGFYPHKRIVRQQRSPVRQEQFVCSYLISSRPVGLAILSLSPLRNSEGSIIEKGISWGGENFASPYPPVSFRYDKHNMHECSHRVACAVEIIL